MESIDIANIQTGDTIIYEINEYQNLPLMVEEIDEEEDILYCIDQDGGEYEVPDRARILQTWRYA